MNKKAIIILGVIFVLIVGTLGFLIYTKYGSNSATPPVSQGNTNIPTSTTDTTGNLPGTQPGATASGSKFVKLLDTQVISPVLFYDGTGVTHFDTSGQLYRTSFQPVGGQLQAGSPQSLQIQTRTDISKVLWPPTGDNFIIESSKGAQKSWSFYNSDTRNYTDLPSQVEALDWLPSSRQIYYVWLQNGKATLNVGDPDTNNWKYIADMWENDDALSVSPDGKGILYYEQNTSTSTNPINYVTPDAKVWKKLVSTGVNYGVLWSPDSQKFLFGKKTASGIGFELWYYNLLTNEVKNLGVMTTVEKAVWSKDSRYVYAAVPTSGTAGDTALTADAFYKLNTETLDKQQYDPGTTVIDGRNLFLSGDESRLFFKNAQDGDLYYLNLSQ